MKAALPTRNKKSSIASNNDVSQIVPKVYPVKYPDPKSHNTTTSYVKYKYQKSKSELTLGIYC